MLSCWYFKPEKRPKFNQLEDEISKILGKLDSQHYIDLNAPYLEANQSRFNSGKTDYLALLKSPDCQAPHVPVNKFQQYLHVLAEHPDDTQTATNDLYVVNDTLESSGTSLSTSEIPVPESISLRTFKPNRID